MLKTTNVPDISFLVTAHSKPAALVITLQSLFLQRNVKSEILVSNNAYGKMKKEISEVCARYPVNEFINEKHNCYAATTFLSKHAKGKFLCFPSEEDYYTPVFGEKLLSHAKKFNLQFVYCDCLMDSRYFGSYEVLRAQPILGHIDKGGFLIKRELFKGWPKTPDRAIAAGCDGMLAEQIKNKKTVPYGKISDILWVHN